MPLYILFYYIQSKLRKEWSETADDKRDPAKIPQVNTILKSAQEIQSTPQIGKYITPYLFI